jgi:hypothetical protein
MGYKEDLSELKDNINMFMVDSILFKQNASKPWNSKGMIDLKVQMETRASELNRLYDAIKTNPGVIKNFGSLMDDFLVNLETFIDNFHQMTLNITPSELYLSNKDILKDIDKNKPNLLYGIENEYHDLN